MTDLTGNVRVNGLHADISIPANGFEALRWFHPLAMYGLNRRSLHEVWDEREGPQIYMGSAMDGLSDFFIATGPNTANGHSSQIPESGNTYHGTHLEDYRARTERACAVRRTQEESGNQVDSQAVLAGTKKRECGTLQCIRRFPYSCFGRVAGLISDTTDARRLTSHSVACSQRTVTGTSRAPQVAFSSEEQGEYWAM